MTTNRQFPATVRSAIEDSLDLLESVDWMKNDRTDQSVDPLPSLLEQCGKLAHDDPTAEPEPIRMIHHFACTGGTLITKCLACVPNVHVLSEVDPLTTKQSPQNFAPSDLISLVEFSNRASDPEEKVELFMAGLGALYARDKKRGLRLLIRNHAHSHFCVGGSVPDRPSLKKLIADRYPVKSIVTVRHPIDSYLSLLANEWIEFTPATVDEYCRRYECFLDTHSENELFRYEDFLEKSVGELEKMCKALDYPYPYGFEDLFAVHRFSGDSGRSGSDLAPRPRREIPEILGREFAQSDKLRRLVKRLGYAADF